MNGFNYVVAVWSPTNTGGTPSVNFWAKDIDEAKRAAANVLRQYPTYVVAIFEPTFSVKLRDNPVIIEPFNK